MVPAARMIRRSGALQQADRRPVPRGTLRKNGVVTEEGISELQKGKLLKIELSRWSRSRSKRGFDIALVLLFSPLCLLLLACIATAVFVSSGMPVLFRQLRMGRGGVPFSIFKFRTMRPSSDCSGSAIAVKSANRITRVGSLLRRTKLDELPQLLNVLTGEMSLVGPRPKVPEQQPEPLPCRPGLTGAATLYFAREEALLEGISPDDQDEYFRRMVLPAKRRLDAEYLRHANMWSDLLILVDTVVGRWESRNWERPGSDAEDDNDGSYTGATQEMIG